VKKALAVSAVSIIAVVVGLSVRIHNFPEGGRYSATGRGYYAADSAMRYRYARMIGEGEEIPRIDRSIQYPEGLEVRSVLFLLCDRFAGYTYRILRLVDPGVDFGAYLRWLICIFGGFAAIPVYLIARRLWDDHMSGLAAAFFYVLSMPSFGRSVGSYLREEFVIPVIFTGIYFFIRANETRRDDRSAILAGVLFLVGLSMWHMTQFFFLVMVVFPASFSLFFSDHCLARSLMFLSIFAAIAGLVDAPLRTHYWLIGPSMVLLYAFVSTWIFTWKKKVSGVNRVFLFVVLSAGCLGLIGVVRGAPGYSHVFALLLAKARFLGRVPADPSRLVFDVRALWTGPFRSPNLATFCIAFTVPLFLSLYPAGRLIATSFRKGWIERARVSDQERVAIFKRSYILSSALLFLPLYLLIARLEVFLVVFLCILAGGLWKVGPRAVRIAIPLMVLFMAREAWQYSDGNWEQEWWGSVLPEDEGSVATSRDESISSLFRMIEERTEPGSVILARYPIGPMILAYTGRKVVVHPIFESEENRRKIEAVTMAAFDTEEGYFTLCRRLGVQYLLYEANTLFDVSPGSDRYMAARMEVSPKWAVYGLHFFPERLRHFRLVGQTRYFRLYQVLGVEDKHTRPEAVSGLPGAHGTGPDGNYSPQFDPDLFSVLPARAVDDVAMREGLSSIAGLEKDYNRAVAEYRAGRYREAARGLWGVYHRLPRDRDARTLLYDSLIQVGNRAFAGNWFSEAVTYFSEAEKLEPESPLPHLLAGAGYASQGKLRQAEAEFLAAYSLDPENPETCEKLGMVYLETGQMEKARRYLERSLEIEPDQPHVQDLLESLRSE